MIDMNIKQEEIVLENNGSNPPVRLLALFHKTYPQTALERLIKTPGRDVWIAAGKNNSHLLRVHAPDLDKHTIFTLRSAMSKRTTARRPLPHWARYPAGVAIELYESEMDLPGMDLLIAGDETPGPRYEYALGMALGAVCYHINQKLCTGDMLVELVERVRREYIRHTLTAISCGMEGRITPLNNIISRGNDAESTATDAAQTTDRHAGEHCR